MTAWLLGIAFLCLGGFAMAEHQTVIAIVLFVAGTFLMAYRTWR